MTQTIKPGDFTGLAKDYSQHRPGYSPSVLNALLGLLDKPVAEIDFTDVGAGTGIWTRMVQAAGVRSVTAVEPNEEMLQNGVIDSQNIKRVSSGRSGITVTLTEQLLASPFFDDVLYLEGRHVIEMTPERYLGAWRSVNDLRVQLGREKFNAFLAFVERRISGLRVIEATYLTRAWSARRAD